MEEIVLERDRRLALRAAAHHLDPVVLLGANGLTEAVLKEIDRELTAHELIKVRVPTDDREEREAIFLEVAQKLGAARVQMIGKLLVLWRPSEEKEEEESEEDRRLSEARSRSQEAQVIPSAASSLSGPVPQGELFLCVLFRIKQKRKKIPFN